MLLWWILTYRVHSWSFPHEHTQFVWNLNKLLKKGGTSWLPTDEREIAKVVVAGEHELAGERLKELANKLRHMYSIDGDQ